MNGKRLRIRGRIKLSEHNLDWVAGQAVGHKEGFVHGVADANRKDAQEKAGLLHEIVTLETKIAALEVKLQKQSHLVLDAKRATAAANKKALELEQKLFLSPARSDWLHVPPFLLRADSAIDKDKLYTNLYGGTVTGRTPGRLPSLMTDAEGGFLTSEISRRMLDQIMNSPAILGSVRTVPMRPPGDPVFHWNAEDDDREDGEPIQEIHGVPVRRPEPSGFVQMMMERPQLIRDAFRHPFQVSSEVRTPEAEEGIRQASAEGVTDMAGGHSHEIALDIRVDDTELRDVVARVEQLGENLRNAGGLPAEQFQHLLERLLHLERMAGVEAPEESPSEENVYVTGRPGATGGEHT